VSPLPGTDPDPEPPTRTGDVPRKPVIRPRRSDRRPVLPDVTSDEQDLGWGDLPESDGDDHLLREVPPHHGS
jgi:hypothetical protein